MTPEERAARAERPLCVDCKLRHALSREEIRERAIMWTATIEADDGRGGLMPGPRVTPGDQLGAPPSTRALACFGLLLVAEYAIRCDACAAARVSRGIDIVGALATADPKAGF